MQIKQATNKQQTTDTEEHMLILPKYLMKTSWFLEVFQVGLKGFCQMSN
jgi:hypothetical protein